MDIKQAFERSAQSNALCYKALRDCQRALCPDFGDCADNLKDGEKCACDFEDGPYANAVPKNRALAEIARLRAEVERLRTFLGIACDDYELQFGRPKAETHWYNHARAALAAGGNGE